MITLNSKQNYYETFFYPAINDFLNITKIDNKIIPLFKKIFNLYGFVHYDVSGAELSFQDRTYKEYNHALHYSEQTHFFPEIEFIIVSPTDLKIVQYFVRTEDNFEGDSSYNNIKILGNELFDCIISTIIPKRIVEIGLSSLPMYEFPY